MLIPTLRGLEGRDDRRRHRVDEVRRGRPPVRDQPGGRLLRRGAGHEREDQPERDGHDPRERDLHQLRPDRRRRRLVGGHDGGDARAPDRLARQRLDAGLRRPAAHPNARFTAPAAQCPCIAPEWEDPAGVPIDAILFGGRRSTVVPLVCEAFDWEHGVFLGATMSSEMTAAAAGTVGELRFDPFAMLPFCGYNMGDYFATGCEIGEREGARAAARSSTSTGSARTRTGSFLWPGFGENSRVLAWVFRRCDGAGRRGARPRSACVPAPGCARHRRPRPRVRATSASCSRSTRSVDARSCRRSATLRAVRRRSAGRRERPARRARGQARLVTDH